MNQSRPLCLRHTLWLAVGLTVASITLGACVLYRYQVYSYERTAHEERIQCLAESYAAQVRPLLLTGSREKAAAFVDELAWHEASSLLAVLNSQAEPIAARGNQPLVDRYLQQADEDRREGTGTGSWRVPADPERGLPAQIMAVVPIQAGESTEQLGTLLYAAKVPARSIARAGQVWQFFGALALVAITGALLGVLWLKQRVLLPLARLAQHFKAAPVWCAGGSPLTERRDEIGEVARILAGMHLERAEWRGRAVRLQNAVDDRVVAETRKITRELRRAQKKAWTDPLTGLGNRRLFDDKFKEIFDAQQKANQDLAVIMLDVDHFKNLNDTLGHQAGDDMLVFIGELLMQCLREQDLAIRYGGDEFVLILPAVTTDQAYHIAERTIRMFGQQARTLPVEPRPSISAGVATLGDHRTASASELIELADQSLYEAKRAGRGRVHTSSTAPLSAVAS